MESVPVWSLPEIPRRRAIHRMKLENILELSLKSKPFHSFMEANKLPQVELWLCLSESSIHINLKISGKHGSKSESVRISFDEDKKHSGSINCASFGIKGGLQAKLVKRHGNYFSVKSCEDQREKLKAMEAISKHIADIAHVRYNLRCTDGVKFDIFRSFLFKGTKSFREVIIKTKSGTRRYQRFGVNNIRHLVENLDIEHLELECGLVGTRRQEFKFSQKSLKLENCRWISPSELLHSPLVEKMEVLFPKHVKPEEFLKIGEAWQRGTHFPNLKQLILCVDTPWPSGMKTILQEDGTLGLAASTDGIRSFCGFSGTIKRLTDGKMAEVEVKCIRVRRWFGASEPSPIYSLTVKDPSETSTCQVSVRYWPGR